MSIPCPIRSPLAMAQKGIGTWIPGGEVEVGEVDHVVVAVLLLVEEPDLRRPSNHVISDHSLNEKKNIS